MPLKGSKTRLFILLWCAGFIGIISFLFVDLGALIALVPTDGDLPPPSLLH